MITFGIIPLRPGYNKKDLNNSHQVTPSQMKKNQQDYVCNDQINYCKFSMSNLKMCV